MMKKMLLLLLASLGLVSTSMEAYLFYVVNNTDIPINADWYVEGWGGRRFPMATIQPGHYWAFPDSVAYCSKEVWVQDARQSSQILSGDRQVPWTKFEIGSNNSCNQHQVVIVTLPLANPNQTDAYYSIFGKKHGDFQFEYHSYLPTDHRVDDILKNKTNDSK